MVHKGSPWTRSTKVVHRPHSLGSAFCCFPSNWLYAMQKKMVNAKAPPLGKKIGCISPPLGNNIDCLVHVDLHVIIVTVLDERLSPLSQNKVHRRQTS